MDDFYGVYRVLKNGVHKYLSHSCTTNKKLAEEIAADLSNGELVMPDGTSKKIQAYPHVAKLMFTPKGNNDA